MSATTRESFRNHLAPRPTAHSMTPLTGSSAHDSCGIRLPGACFIRWQRPSAKLGLSSKAKDNEAVLHWQLTTVTSVRSRTYRRRATSTQ
jgi:hypothetical protein